MQPLDGGITVTESLYYRFTTKIIKFHKKAEMLNENIPAFLGRNLCHQQANQFAGFALREASAVGMTELLFQKDADVIGSKLFFGNQGEDHFLLPVRHGRR